MVHPVGVRRVRRIQSVNSLLANESQVSIIRRPPFVIIQHKLVLIVVRRQVQGADLKERRSANTYIMPIERLRLRGIRRLARIKSL